MPSFIQLSALKYAHWIAKKHKIPFVIHLADHSLEFERSFIYKYPPRSIQNSLYNRGNEVHV